MMVMLFRCLLLLQYPQFTQPLNLLRVSCVFLALGKLRYGKVFSSFVERKRALFFQSSKVPSKGNSLMSCCIIFFDNWHWDACICLWQLTRDLLFMVSSIQIARLLAHCVLIGSLAELLFAFACRVCWHFCRWLMLSLARWCHQWLPSWLWKSIVIPNSFMA